MIKVIFSTLGVIIISFVLVFIIFLQTKDDEVLQGDFQRRIHVVDLTTVFSLPKKGTYIAGVDKDSIFFGNHFQMNWFGSLHCVTGESKEQFLKPVSTFTKLIVHHPYLFQVDEMNRCIFRINLMHQGDVKEFKLASFTDAIPITRSSFAFRTFNESKTELQLSKTNGLSVQHFPGLLQKQLDGVVCTDGMLTLNAEEEKIFYIYYYRNQYLVMDTSLHLLYSGQTIDSISHVKINLAEMGEDKSRMLSSPTRVVNRHVYSADSLLYIVSNVVGKNESQNDYRKGSMIDCYTTHRKSYQHSIYLHNYKDQKLKQMVISGSKLFALYKNHLVIYSLDSLKPIALQDH
jgi:hypothetical protein